MKKVNLMMVPVLLAGVLAQSNVAVAKGTVVGKVGTLGGGLEYVYPFNTKLALGVGINGLSYDDSIEESDIDYDATLDMQTFSLIGDYHPFANGFRMSAGIMQNGNEFSLIGTPTGSETVTIGDSSREYTADEIGSLESLIGFKSTAPYLGIGWGKAPASGKGWGFDADLGVLFQGSPEVSLTATCGDLSEADCDTLQEEVENEEESLRSDSDDLEYFPVISIGASYTF